MYFREGEKEDMACGGALAVHALIKSGILDINDIPSAGKDRSLWNDDDMKKAVCGKCEFRADDCDFASDKLPDCEPCGGFILLTILKKKGLIDSEKIEICL